MGTSPMEAGRRTGTNWLLVVGIVLLVFLVGGGLTAALIIKKVNEAVRSGGVDGPAIVIPDVTVVEQGTTDPEKLPPSLKPWYYPEATVRHAMSGGIGSVAGGVLTMTTEDEVDEVADHYRDLIASGGGKVVEHRDGEKVIFPESGRAIVIKPDDKNPELTEIVVALGSAPGVAAPSAPSGGVPPPPRMPTAPMPPAPGVPPSPPPTPPASR